MAKLIFAIVLVVAVMASGLVALLRSRRLAMPSREVLDRVKKRNLELEAKERREQ